MDHCTTSTSLAALQRTVETSCKNLIKKVAQLNACRGMDTSVPAAVNCLKATSDVQSLPTLASFMYRANNAKSGYVEIRYQFLVPNELDYKATDSGTVYAYGDVNFNFPPATLPDVLPFNQIIPQIITGYGLVNSTCNQAVQGGVVPAPAPKGDPVTAACQPIPRTKDQESKGLGWRMQAQYFWQYNRPNPGPNDGGKAIVGELVKVDPGDLITSKIRYNSIKGDIDVTMCAMTINGKQRKRSKINIPYPYPDLDAPNAPKSWKEFFDTALQANPQYRLQCDMQIEPSLPHYSSLTPLKPITFYEPTISEQGIPFAFSPGWHTYSPACVVQTHANLGLGWCS